MAVRFPRDSAPQQRPASSGLFRGLAVAAVALGLAACGDPAEREARYLDRGKALYAEGDRVKALIEFKNALQINPRGVEARYYMALISEDEGDLRAAFGSFHRVIEQDPDHVAARLKLGNYYFFAEALEQARQHADAVLAIAPRNADALALRAAIALREHRGAEARAGAEQALGIDPGNVGAVSVLTGVHVAEGDVGRALQLLDEAIGDEANLPLLRLKAEIQTRQDDHESLERTYRRMIAAAPADPELRASLAQLHLRGGRADAAEAVLREGIAAAPGSWPMKALLVAYLVRNGGPGAAERELLALQESDAANPDYGFALAELYESAGALDKAEAQLQVMTERYRDESRRTALSSLARLKARQGDVNAASDLIRRALSEDPEHTASLLLRAALYIESGSLMNAVTDLRTVLRRRPNDLAALELVSEAHRRRGELDLAVDALRQAVAVSQGDARIRLQLAQVLHQQGDSPGARGVVEEVLRQRPNAPAGWAALTRLHLLDGAWDKAARTIAELEKLPDGALAARQLQAELLGARGEHAAAADAYRELLEAGAGGAAIAAFTGAALRAGRTGEAIAALEKALGDGPAAEQPAGWLSLGRVYLAENRPEQARAAFETAVALAPHRADGYMHLGELLIRSGQVQAAKALLRQGLDAGASPPPLLFMLALGKEHAGHFDQAYDTYEQLLRHDPDSEVAANNLAALVATHFHEDERRMQRALALGKRLQGSRNPLILDTVAWLSFRAGDVETAARLFEQIKDVDHPEIRYHRGVVLMALGREDEAREELVAAVESGAAFHGRDDAKRLLSQ